MQENPKLSEKEKDKITREICDPETTWRAVFEKMEISIEEHEVAELEFRKALYKLKFDRAWLNDIYKIENKHYTVMGAIMEFTKPTNENVFTVNPLDLPNSLSAYKYDVELPFLKDFSEELMIMLC